MIYFWFLLRIMKRLTHFYAFGLSEQFEPEAFVDGLLGIGKAGGGKSSNEGAKLAARLEVMRKERDARAKERKSQPAPEPVGVAAPSAPMMMEDDSVTPVSYSENPSRPRGNPNKSKKKKKKGRR